MSVIERFVFLLPVGAMACATPALDPGTGGPMFEDPADAFADPATDPGATPVDPTPGDGSSGTAALPMVDPDLLLILGDFGYDPASNQAVGVEWGGGVVYPPSVTVIVANAQWAGTFEDQDNYCVVLLSASGDLPEASWASATAGVVFGWDLPSDPEILGDCDDRIDSFTWSDPSASLASLNWSIGVSGSVDAELRQSLVDGGWTAQELDTTIGHGIGGSLGEMVDPTGYFGQGLAFGMSVDADFVISQDAGGDLVELAASEMVSGGSLEAGAYTTQMVFPWDAIGPYL